MDPANGLVLLVSQFKTVQVLIPRRRAAWFWINLRMRRHRLMCLPSVLGISLLWFQCLKPNRYPGKKATRPCVWIAATNWNHSGN